jgi:uncharacterized protein involved in exopolysaccharide biosynthesis
MITRPSPNGHSTDATSGMNVREACRVLFRHKWKMLVFFCSAFALLIIGLSFYPRTYISDARLLVRLGKESVSLDPTATLSQTVPMEGSRESEINSELEILRSRGLLEDVVARLGSDEILGSREFTGSWTDLVSLGVDTLQVWLTGDMAPAELAVNKLEKVIRAASPRKSNIIIISCKAANPEQAQRILQAYLDAFLVRHTEVNRTLGSHDFFVEQATLLQKHWEASAAALRKAKDEIGLVSIDGRRQNVQRQADLIEQATMENDRTLASLEARMGTLNASLSRLPAQVVAEVSEKPNLGADAMRTEFYRVQILEKDAVAHFTAEHPRIIALRDQVESTKKILEEQQEQRPETTKRLNVVHQGVHTELLSVQGQVAAAKALQQSLERQNADIQNKIRLLNENEVHITELGRKAELIERNYLDYANKSEQARIDQALATGRISNINVVQPASFTSKAYSPQPVMVLILGIAVAVFGSVLVAFGCELFDRTLKTPEQIEHELGIPVLLSVPRRSRMGLLKSQDA